MSDFTFDKIHTRAEHLQWCKDRAIAELNRGGIPAVMNAWKSMMSDLSKHSETKDHIAIDLGCSLMMVGGLCRDQDMRDFINGFN